MRIKKLFSVIIALCLIAVTFVMNVSAEDEGIRLIYEIETHNYAFSESCSAQETQYLSYLSIGSQELRECIFEGLYNCQAQIDISKFGFLPTQENCDMLGDFIWKEMPEAFHVGNKMSFNGCTDLLVYINLEYNCTAEEYQTMYADFEKSANDMVKDLKGGNLTDVQKALLLHDRLAINCEYDTEGFNNNTLTYKAYTAYGALVEGLAVCQGYAEAYDYLLEKVGIDSILCSSDALKHAWNIVYIDGKPYHVDVTWDDPVYENPTQKPAGYVSHKNFLLSSDALKGTDHVAKNEDDSEIVDYNTSPTDTTYDSYFWQNSFSEFHLMGNNIYYFNNNGAFCGYDEKMPLVDAGLGDINGDKKIDAMDVSRCRQFLVETETPEDTSVKACDINKDGKINILDLVHFKRILIYIG